jgi:hypothetical protein
MQARKAASTTGRMRRTSLPTDEGAIAGGPHRSYGERMSAQIDTVETPTAPQSFLVAHRRALVIGSRTAMLMLLIAALAVLGLGILAAIRGGSPEVEGWLRVVFGKVFAVVAVAMAAVLGIPAAIGLAAMSGATTPEAVPALPRSPRLVVVGLAIATVAATALAILLGGTQSLLLNLGVAGLIALALLGLGGAVWFTPHRGRGWLATAALLAVAAGTLWILFAVGR